MNRLLLIILISTTTCAFTVQAQTVSGAEKGSRQGALTHSVAAPNEKKEGDCGCDSKVLPDVLAIINDVRITSKDIDEPIKNSLSSLYQQVIDARKRELYLQINSILLDAEAKKRGISPSKLLEEEVIAKTKEPTDEEAQVFYNQNKDRILGEFKDVKAAIINYLLNQRQSNEAKKLADRLRAASDVKILAADVTPPESEADRARILATVDGKGITSGDVEDALQPLIFSVQEQIYNLRKNELELKINNLLLEQEAQKRKITSRALLETEVTLKIKKVSETDARGFYEQNKDKIGGEYAQLKDQLVQYLQAREQRTAESSFASALRQAASIQVFLPAPEAPVYAIATDDQPSKGDAAAPVTIVEFTDYQCPSCAGTQPIIEQLLKEYANKLRLVMCDFPLAKHQNAFKAAEAAEAAREQGKYWDYIAILFNSQSALGIDKLKEYASKLGLDRQKFDQALDSGKFAEKVRRDLQDGLKIGINSTPTIFVNGKRIQERSYESLKAAVENALKTAAKQ